MKVVTFVSAMTKIYSGPPNDPEFRFSCLCKVQFISKTKDFSDLVYTSGGCNSLHSRVIFEIRVRVHQCFSDKKGELKKKKK